MVRQIRSEALYAIQIYLQSLMAWMEKYADTIERALPSDTRSLKNSATLLSNDYPESRALRRRWIVS